jgi:hypothetical protein
VSCKGDTTSGEEDADASVNSFLWASDDPHALLDPNGSKSEHAVLPGLTWANQTADVLTLRVVQARPGHPTVVIVFQQQRCQQRVKSICMK